MEPKIFESGTGRVAAAEWIVGDRIASAVVLVDLVLVVAAVALELTPRNLATTAVQARAVILHVQEEQTSVHGNVEPDSFVLCAAVRRAAVQMPSLETTTAVATDEHHHMARVASGIDVTMHFARPAVVHDHGYPDCSQYVHPSKFPVN